MCCDWQVCGLSAFSQPWSAQQAHARSMCVQPWSAQQAQVHIVYGNFIVTVVARPIPWALQQAHVHSMGDFRITAVQGFSAGVVDVGFDLPWGQFDSALWLIKLVFS